MKKHISLFVLGLILVIATFFRFWMLPSVPPSPSLDEVTIGYNAYSILHTGHDEYGNFLPLILRAYDDFRPALYVYLVIPFIKMFGLTVLAVRLPSVILSLITIFTSYFLVLELLPTYKNKKILALVTSFLLSISPWSIYISRLGHEANLGLTCAVVAIYTFLYSVNHAKKRWLLIVAAFFFAISLDSYQSDKVFMPIMAILLGILFFKQLWSSKKILFIAIAVGIVVSLPFVFMSLNQQGLTRFDSTSAFSNIKPLYEQTARQLLLDKQRHNIVGEILDNRRMVIPRIFIENFISHFSPSWLFANGGQDAFKAPGVGLFYPWEILFMIAGILFIFTLSLKPKILIIGWVIAALIAPSITTQAPHAMRALNILPMPQIIVALGIIGILQLITIKRWKYYFLGIYIVILGYFIISQSIYFYKQYFYAFPQKESKSFQYSLSSAVKYAINNQSKYSYILFSNSDSLLQSYMFYLYYSKYNPSSYLAMGGTKSGGFAQWHTIGKFDFRPINWSKDMLLHNALIVGNISDFPRGVGFTKSFADLNGKIRILAIGK